MRRLYVICEGLTEVNFVTQLLQPHLEQRDPQAIKVSAPNLKGYRTFAGLSKFVKSLLASPGPEVIVTSMIDLFKIPGDFPGLAAANFESPGKRVCQIEQRFTEVIGDNRFFAYLQLHEFEALLLADLTALIEQHPNRRKDLDELKKRLDLEFDSPEHVDRLSPPSYRIKDAVPEYSKTVDGPITASRIGFPKLREKCPHFGQWLKRMEDLTPLPIC
jgi:hypothetical protein